MFVKELLKKYNGKTVVDGVSFELPKGKVISLIGPNGAGKSTVMGMISRLIAQDDGSVDFEGKDMSKWKSRDLARRLAILTQSNHVQMKLTVRELVAFGRFPYSGNRITAEDEEIIEKAIAYMELEEFEDRFIDELSGGQIVGMPKSSKIDYLMEYNNNEDIVNLGTLKEVDMEALMASEPDVIFIGGRLSAQYDELSKIAPVVYTAVDYEEGVIQSVKNNAAMIASIFGEEERAAEELAGFDARVETLRQAAEGKTAVIGMVTSSNFNTLGDGSRCSLIGNEVGFTNLANDVDSTHGNESSFELLVSLNPDYIFVLDRDSAINTEGAKLAAEVMDNELVKKTEAYKNGHIVYLTPTVWYLAEGGITAADVMLSDLEAGILGQE